MTKKILVVIMAVCLLVSMMTIFPFAEDITPDTTWYNTTDTSFTLYDAADLAGLASLVNAGTDNFSGKTIVLGNSIDLNNEEWTPIGTSESYPFSGTFDGCGYTVSNLYINNSSGSNQGLFGCIGTSGTVQNVTVSGNVTGYVNVGGVVGMNAGTVTNCTNCATVSATTNIGGVVGQNSISGTVKNCYNSGSISGTGNLGGVVGFNSGGTVANCCNSGSVTSNSIGYDYVGGVVGYSGGGTVKNCYNSGAVSGNYHVGGVVGDDTSTVSNCYYLTGTATAGIGSDSGSTSVAAKTTTQFASGEVTYLLTGGVTDGTQVWYQTIGSDSYPVLDSTHGTVYYGTNCTGTSAYSNTNLSTSGGHIYTSTVTTEATCGATGLMTYTCSVCGESYTETIAATGNHTVVTDQAVAATCTETGLTEGSHCSVCNEVFVAQTEIPANGHTKVTDEAVEATCTETGLTEGSHCSVCNEVIVAQEVVAATGHSYEATVTAPTCTEGGYTTYTCSVCGDSYVADETAATGHSYTVSWSWDGTSAMATVSCSDCGDSYEQKATITTQSNYGQTIYIAIVRVGDVTYTTSKTTGTITIPTTDSTSEVITEEVETTEPIEGTDTETEPDEEAEAETNPTTGMVLALLPMALALAGTVAVKKRLG